MSRTEEIVIAARATLDRAVALDWPTLALSDEVKAWLLGQVWGESRFGSTKDWGASNNWGAVTYHLKDGKYIEHADHSADGKPVVYKFQAYDTQLAAARAWLRVLLRGDVPAALTRDDVRGVAAAMYRNHYYTGINGTASDRIEAYARLIERGAAFISGELADVELGLDLDTVAGAQEACRRLGHDPGPVDGIYGPKSRAAVTAFQRERGIKADGIVGPVTRSAFRAALEQSH